MQKKEKRLFRAKWILGALSLVLGARYLYWRGFYTLNTEDALSATISGVLYLAEIYGFFAVLFFYFQVFRPTDRREAPPWEGELPTVDLFVTIYNESIDILKRTLVAAAAVDYPAELKKIYVLDDGRRDEVKAMAEWLGCHYLSRQTNERAKAGNLNHGLGRTRGDLVLVMDCDHVPVRTFLRETVGFLKDPRVALVQTPHYFYNPDMFQRNLRLEREIVNEQDLFFYLIQPGKDGFNAAFFAGSGGIFRRSALEEIGGFQAITLTEDLHTSMALHAKGYRSVYYNKILAAGLAPESYRGYLKQRQRWTRGGVQLFVLDNPLFKRGLTWMQRLHYFASIFYFFHGWARWAYLIAPLSYFLLNRSPLTADFSALLNHYLPYYFASLIAFDLIAGKYRNPFWSDVYETVMCFFISWTALGALLRPEETTFDVTPKGMRSDQSRLDWSFVAPHLLLSALLGVGLALGAYRWFGGRPVDSGATLLSGFWTLYNLVILTAAIVVARERPQKRAAPRLFRRIPCELKFNDRVASGTTSDLSETGLSLALDRPALLPPVVHVRLAGEFGETTEVAGTVIRNDRPPSGGASVGIRFVGMTEAQRQSLIRQMYSAPSAWKEAHPPPIGVWRSFGHILTSSVRAFVKEKILRRTAPRLGKRLACEVEAEGRVYKGMTEDLSDTGASIRLIGDEILSKEVTVHLYQGDRIVFGVLGEIVRRKKVKEGEILYGVQFLERKEPALSAWV